MGKFSKITNQNFNDYINYLIEKYDYVDAIYYISEIEYPDQYVKSGEKKMKIGKDAGLYYETYKKYMKNIKIDKDFNKNSYTQNKELFNKVH